MNTTIVEFFPVMCGRCGGKGHLPQFQHRKGGECFACGGTGRSPQMKEVEREMTDQEVLSALEEKGFPVVFVQREETGDWLTDLFNPDMPAIMEGARAMLRAL